MSFVFAFNSPLHFAAESGNVEIVQMLLDKGADLFKIDVFDVLTDGFPSIFDVSSQFSRSFFGS
jgi:ankyrin repeat protein